MNAQQSAESDDLTVTIFGRPCPITQEQLRATVGVLSLLPEHDSLTQRERDALDRARRIVQRLTTPPASTEVRHGE